MIIEGRIFRVFMKTFPFSSLFHPSDHRFSFWARILLPLIPPVCVLFALPFLRTDGLVFQGVELWRNVVSLFFVLILFGAVFRAWNIRFLMDLLIGASLIFGVWIFFGAIMPVEIAVIVASFVTLIQAFFRKIFVYDFVGMIGLSGLSLTIVSFLSVKTLLVVFVAWLIYDIVVKRDISSEIPPPIYRGYIPVIFFPKTAHGFLDDVSMSFREKTSDMMMVGEILLPTVFVAGAGVFGLWQGALIVFGLAIGAFASVSRRIPFRLPLAMLLGSGVPFFVMIFLCRFV